MNEIKNSERLIDFVNTYTGSKGVGNCLIGPYRPLGMVRLGPDTHYPAPNNGYQSGQTIKHFSHTHVAGTGGPGRYGNVGITPFTGKPATHNVPPFISAPIDRFVDTYPEDEKSSIGYYCVTLKPWNVFCELTTTKHVGIHKYQFPKDATPNILFDAGACITNGDCLPTYSEFPNAWDSVQGSTGGWLQIISDHEIVGRSDFRGGWGHDKSSSIYYYFHSDASFNKTLLVSEGGYVPSTEGCEVTGKSIRCSINFKELEVLNLKVGISFVSIANARGYVEQEVAQKSFEAIRSESENEWESLLSTFKIEGGTDANQRSFYSFLNRIYCMPTDLGVDEENPFWKSGVRQFTDFYCLWDSVRNANSFFHMFYPSLSRDILNSLIDIAEHTGWLPDAHIANQHGYMQSACACDILFSEAAIKGIIGVNYEKALKYTKKNNEVPTPDILAKGRYIDDYNNLGYLSTNVAKGSVSRHLEYTYHDWCIAQLAEFIGDAETQNQYLENSKRVWNLWREDTKTFFPRHASGKWLENYDPWKMPAEAWNDPSCYEGSTAVWSFNTFHDIYGLIDRIGGKESFIKQLDRVFDQGLFKVKETRMHLPHLYTYAGRPDLAAQRILETLETFSAQADGLKDNEDMGCQSAYFLWNSMGLYPIYGQEHYMLTPPLFDKIEVKIEGNKNLLITADRTGLGKYIQQCFLGGKLINRAWVTHSELLKEEHLHFVIGDRKNDFGTNCPPPRAL